VSDWALIEVAVWDRVLSEEEFMIVSDNYLELLQSGSGAESPCLAGHYCKTPSTITLCPAGSTAVEGSTTEDACSPYDFGSSCAAAIDLATIGSPYSGTTVGQPNDFSPSCFTSDSDSGEQIFSLDMAQGKILLYYCCVPRR
jgi:hypothetical protein